MLNVTIMLLPTMNHEEIYSQVHSEFEKIKNTTIVRLVDEYDRERRKLKIKKDNSYVKEYPIKTHGKNNWIIFLHKSPAIEKYKTGGYRNFLAIVYYYSDQGLRVLHTQENVLVSFTSHFFKRYNERMKLNLSNPLDIVKSYFRPGTYGQNKMIEKGSNTHIIGFRPQGLQFGLVKYNSTYIEWKTFVNRELAFRSQEKMERDAIRQLKAGIEAVELFQSVGMFEEEAARNLLLLQNSYLSLTGERFTA